MNIYKSGKSDYTEVSKDHLFNLSMNFQFTNDSKYIRSNNYADDCGYGYRVYSQGDFKLIDSNIPEFYFERNGDNTFFDKIKSPK